MVEVAMSNIEQYLQQNGWTYEQDEDWLLVYESGIPYLFIQVIEDINDELNEQYFTAIHNGFENSFFALTDGQQTNVACFMFGKGIVFDDVHSVEEFLKIPASELAIYNMYGRIPNHAFLAEPAVIGEYMDFGIVSEVSDPFWQAQYTELANALYYEPYEPTNRSLPITIVEDEMLEYRKSNNASGGGYEGLHRKFAVQLPDESHVSFVISMFATANLRNDAVYGTSIGRTQLNIAMLHKPNSTYNLQVNLDQFIEKKSDRYEIWHNGKRSRLKTEYVMKTVQQIAPQLLDGDRVSLGEFLLNDSIDRTAFARFIENIITYSYCRYEADLLYR